MPEKDPDISANLKVEIDGVPAITEAGSDIAKQASEKTMGFLSKLCGPGAEQLGLALADKIAQWRCRNYLKFLEKAEGLYTRLKIDPSHKVDPRLMLGLAESASMQSDDSLQDWWAGLMVSSCSPDGSDENLIFVHLMDKITCLQAKIFKYACENADIVHTKRGLLIADSQDIAFEDLCEISGVSCAHQLDRELDALRNLGIFDEFSGFNMHNNDDLKASVAPSSLGLQFYARCQGQGDGLIEFFAAKPMEKGRPCRVCGESHD